VLDANSILEQARVIKSPDELICMKAAIEVAEKGSIKDEIRA
jgi:Xaa-Pro aminopeptidase